jgi:hypothetical protein
MLAVLVGAAQMSFTPQRERSHTSKWREQTTEDHQTPARPSSTSNRGRRMPDARCTLPPPSAGRWHGGYGTGRCPEHDEGTPSLAIRRANLAPVHCAGGVDERKPCGWSTTI